VNPEREGCCSTWPKPCSYHEGWQDAMDAVEARSRAVRSATLCPGSESELWHNPETGLVSCPSCNGTFRFFTGSRTPTHLCYVEDAL